MKKVFLSVGSNIEPEKNIPAAIGLLKKHFPALRISSLYETDPLGPSGKECFWNFAAAIETEKKNAAITAELREIEAQLGRKRDGNNKFAPRTIDIDVLPQPDYQRQAFIMIPLAEIAPREKDPETGKSYEELARGLKKERGKVRKIR